MSVPPEPADGSAITPQEALELLAGGEMKLLGLMPRASNYTFLAEVTRDDVIALAVYKPRDGEQPLWDFPDGTLCLREVAAYVVSEAMGFGFVPPTVLRDGPYGVGSAQMFVVAQEGEHYLSLASRFADQFRSVAAFDIAINNADRKSGHCLLEVDTERIFVVDHGVSLHEEPKLRTVIWDFAGEPLPDAAKAGLAKLKTALEEGGDSAKTLSELLNAREMTALRGRVETLIKRGKFPEPGPGRPYPWPAV